MIYCVIRPGAGNHLKGHRYISSRDEKYTVCVLSAPGTGWTREIGDNFWGYPESVVGEVLLGKANDLFCAESAADKMIKEVNWAACSSVGMNVPENGKEISELLGRYWLVLLYSWDQKKLVYLKIGRGAVFVIRNGYSRILTSPIRGMIECGVIETEDKADSVLLLTEGAEKAVVSANGEISPIIISMLEDKDPESAEEIIFYNNDIERGFIYFELSDEEE